MAWTTRKTVLSIAAGALILAGGVRIIFAPPVPFALIREMVHAHGLWDIVGGAASVLLGCALVIRILVPDRQRPGA